jgi:osmotically-inducible protein OsmY
MATKSDAQINQDIFDELTWDPAIHVVDLNIATIDGRVTLTGAVPTYGTKEEATEAAYRVSGVRSVDNEIAVHPSESDLRGDSAIADLIKSALLVDYQVPDQRINVEVNQGHVTLTGSVDWAYQRQAAVDDVLKFTGVTSVEDLIKLTPPHASADEIQRGIARAFARNAELSDDKIVVEAEGGHVTLSGNVGFWSEYDLAENIAWKSPGVTSVTNNIEVLIPHGLRNEITTLPESAEPSVVFTPLVW